MPPFSRAAPSPDVPTAAATKLIPATYVTLDVPAAVFQ